MITNKEISTYISKIKMLLPIYTRNERKFVKKLEDNIYIYAESHSNASMEDINNIFGEPLEIVQGYIDSMDFNALVKAISIRKNLRRITVGALLLAIAILLIFGGFYYKGYQYYKSTIITENETVIANE